MRLATLGAVFGVYYFSDLFEEDGGGDGFGGGEIGERGGLGGYYCFANETFTTQDEEEYEDGNEDEDDLEDLDDEGEEDDEDESQVSADKIKVGGVEVPLGEGGYDPDEDSVHDPSIKKEVRTANTTITVVIRLRQ